MSWLLIFTIYSASLLVPTPHTITLESVPTGANIKYRGEWRENTPAQVRIIWFPGRWLVPPLNTVRIRAPGYRPTRVRIGGGVGRQIALDKALIFFPTSLRPLEWQRHKRLLGLESRHVHSVHMMRRHGRSGTWTVEDAERMK